MIESKNTNLIEIKNELLKIIEKFQIESLKKKILEYKNSDYKVKVAFLGEFSAGKSTLVNALMRKNFLPTFDKPTTAIITELQKGAEYKFEVAERIDGEDKITEISPSDLVDEVQKSGADRMLKISVPDSELISDDTLIIDTPGVSSINETHSDVTYGYIPMVDVAFLVVNINMGSISKSLTEFINQYPDEIKNKLFFVLNFADTKAPSERKKLIEEFTQSVSIIVDSPKIYEVSALNAIKANNSGDQELYKKSGIEQIEKIIIEELPLMKAGIKEQREKEFLLEIKDSLINVLEEIKDNLDKDDEGLSERIKELRNEINQLEMAEKSFFNSIKKMEDKAIEEATDIADQYVDELIEKFIQKEPYAENIADMFQEIQMNLINNLPDFENFEISTIEDTELAKTISTISSKIGSKFQRGQEYSKLAMSGLIAVVFPAQGALNVAEFAAGYLIQTSGGSNGEPNESKNIESKTSSSQPMDGNQKTDAPTSKSLVSNSAPIQTKAWHELSGKQKALRIGGGFLKATTLIIEKVNLFEHAANAYNKNTQTDKLRRELRSKANLIVTKTYSTIKNKANDHVEEYFKMPLNSKIEALDTLRKNRDEKNYLNEKKARDIYQDLIQLKSI
ncbi:dynamin family protein [Belliella sp. DSM 107340]|uniref:Dynamin family protein n=1 Tax=Belliella calami TaxID=2923436 RepID=A0ABS9USL7_9BACT|nr:dynamin family protein [Belliella calami]MCH7399205.1 dynamin family protein [Belliella calami]